MIVTKTQVFWFTDEFDVLARLDKWYDGENSDITTCFTARERRCFAHLADVLTSDNESPCIECGLDSVGKDDMFKINKDMDIGMCYGCQVNKYSERKTVSSAINHNIIYQMDLNVVAFSDGDTVNKCILYIGTRIDKRDYYALLHAYWATRETSLVGDVIAHIITLMLRALIS